jgi:acyl-CoA synthetase (AMP-forming)/AMP-acid ligase II
MSFTTLVDVLRARAREVPESTAHAFLKDGEGAPEVVTYRELDRRARAIQQLLVSRGAPGERALLLYPAGHEYNAALFGALYAGVIAVPAYPPRPNRPTPRLESIAEDSDARLVLTTRAILSSKERLIEKAPYLAKLEWIATDGLEAKADFRELGLRSDTIAILQYTSGSTGMPKGVVIDHSNLLHNMVAIHRSFGITERSRGLGWLPPYHDMGLIGGVLGPVFAGIPIVLMSPFAFLQRPLRWLRAISEDRATISGAPCFAYALAIERTTPEQREKLDLSSWEVAFVGAEPVRGEVLEQFAEAFARSGFRKEAFYPCYGLAEATLIVSGGKKGSGPTIASHGGRTLVGCGRAVADHELEIVDSDRKLPCAKGTVGEIWVRGPSVARGYWGNKASEAFGRQIEGREGSVWLRTGDLGIRSDDGELYVTGRIKDLLIIAGRNVYPDDVERSVEAAHSAIRMGGVAAFGFEDKGEERLGVAIEIAAQKLGSKRGEIVAAVKKAVAEDHELSLREVLFLEPGEFPRTSSGKVQRGACREIFLSGGARS